MKNELFSVLVGSLVIGSSWLVIGCGSSGGPGSANGGSPGAVGASGASGANSPAASGAGGLSNASGSLCEQQFDANEQLCPVGAASKDANVQDCLLQEREFAGNGCQPQFDAWLLCTTKPGYNCDQDTGCETSQNGYFACQSQAVQRTGCVRLASQDPTRCADPGKPYAFSCLGSAPAVCTQVVSSGAGIWCCPEL